ncbi:MAG: C-terminal binding protein [Pseudomonadota bacterium]
MTYNILWPTMRWPDDRHIELDAAGEHSAVFVDRFADVSDEQWAACDVVVSTLDIPEEHRAKLSRCRIFITPKVGFDNIDLSVWGELGIPVCNVPDYGTQEVADHALALMMSLMKGITFHTRELKADIKGNWRPALNPFGKRLSDCTFGVLGLGRIGTAAALRAKAFGMRVVFFDPYLPNGSDLALGVERLDSLQALMAASDVLSVHVPLSTETEKLLNADAFAHAKPGMVLINTARGPIIDLDALHDALRNDQVQAVGLDVLPVEPADPNHPLLSAWSRDEEWVKDRLLLTPHSAFYTPESMRDMRAKGVHVAIEYLDGGRLQNCVNEHLLLRG